MRRKILLSLSLFGIVCISMGQGGPLVWKFAHVGNYADPFMLESDQFGNTYLAGTFNDIEFQYEGISPVPGVIGGESESTFILKVDQTGKPLWLHSAHGITDGSNVRPTKMRISQRGEAALILTANNVTEVVLEDQLISADSSGAVPIIVKYSKMGAIRWAYSIKCVTTTPEIAATDLFLDENGDVYVTGYFRGETATLNGAEIDGIGTDAMLFVACIRSDGSLAWFRPIPTDNGDNGHIIPSCIANTPDNFFYVAGTYEGYRSFIFGTDSINNASQKDVFIARFNKNGFGEWGVQLRGDSIDVPEAIRVLNDNSLIVAGMYNSNFFYIDSQLFTHFNQTFNLFLARFAPNGNYINSYSIDTEIPYLYTFKQNAYLNTDNIGNIYICSEFYSDEVFPTDGTLTNAEGGTSDIFVAKLSSNTFDPYWTFHGSAPGDNSLEAVSVDSKGQTYIGGTSYSAETVNLGDDALPVNAIEGVPYLARISTEGIRDYLYFQDNLNENQISVKALSSDGYGNTYVCGRFNGASSSLDEIDLTNMGESGIYVAKYSYTKPVHGEVFKKDGDPFTEGYVKIYGRTFYQRAPVNDSVPLSTSGTFEFVDLPYGEYIMVAIPEGEAARNYVPTYYPTSEYWEFAEEIVVNESATDYFFTLLMQEPSDFDGETHIVGNVQEEEYRKSLAKIQSKARPSKKSKIVLAGSKAEAKSTYQIINFTETDDDGNFTFSNIDDGNYYVWVDIPGLPCEPVYFVTVSGGSWISNLNYLVTEEVVEGTGYPVFDQIESPASEQGFRIYPNPATDEITIEIEDFSQGIVDIYDCQGSHLEHIVLRESLSRLDLSEMPSGTYLIRIMTEDQLVFRKFTLNK